MISGQEALERLLEGNRRFVSGNMDMQAQVGEKRRSELVAGQTPFAIVLGCSDSRVPVEVVFDQGLGDLFVVRVAGNIAAPSQVGSIEFAADHIGSRLVVVLGHAKCGAIRATLAEIREPSGDLSPSLKSITDRIRPALEPLLATECQKDSGALTEAAVRANVRATVQHLRTESPLLGSLVKRDGLLIVGAEYSLETGCVELIDDLPGAG